LKAIKYHNYNNHNNHNKHNNNNEDNQDCYFEVNNFRKFFTRRNFVYTEISYTRSGENVPHNVLNTTSGHYQRCITGSMAFRVPRTAGTIRMVHNNLRYWQWTAHATNPLHTLYL